MRLRLETQLRDVQRTFDHERRLLRVWGIVAIILILLFSGSIAGGIYLGLAWYWLTFFSFLGMIGSVALFVSAGGETVVGVWQHRKEIAKVKDELYLLDEAWKQTPSTEQYMEYYRQVLVPQVIEEYQKQSRVNRFFHLVLQMSIIVASLLVTGLTSGLDAKLGLSIPWAAPILSFLVSLCTAILGFFKYKERSFHLQQTADAIEQERTALKLGIRNYNGRGKQDAFTAFAEEVERLREEQRKRQQQLEQSSDSKQAQATG